jgi:hypothetical protein
MEDGKKLFFGELGDGDFSRVVQEEFEKAQAVAEERGLMTKVNISIAIQPPRKGERFGAILYEVDTKLPKRSSPALTTEWNGNRIIADGKSMADILQTEMNLDLDQSKNLRIAENR